MDSMKKIISSFAIDVDDYLKYVEDYGKPNYKYFNYVLNRMGILYVFISKSEIFRHQSVAAQFVEGCLVTLKKKFLTQDSPIKRSAIVLFMSKLFFTDDLANTMKLRVTGDEWKVFGSYLKAIKDKPEFLTFRIVFYQLFTENFFRFTVKNKTLALDYGTPDHEEEIRSDSTHSETFWDEIRQEVEVLEKSEVVNLMQLHNLREEAIDPFKNLFPEKSSLSEALNEFEAIKTAIRKPIEIAAPSKVSRKEVSQACKDFLKKSGAGSVLQQIDIEEVEWDSDFEVFEPTSSTEVTKTRKRKAKRPPKTSKVKEETSSSDSESDKCIRFIGLPQHNVLKDISGEKYPEKLEKFYGKVEKD